jgi:hypothetical protein
MGLGLPLLGVLTVPQFRAILAHEFAHYYGGDTRLGPWLYRTRNGMVRTIKALGEPSALLRALSGFVIVRLLHSLVVTLLVAYWKVFLRVTQFMARKQEFRADELACRIAGSSHLIDGLRMLHSSANVLPAYWASEVSPVVNAGFRPPLATGFAAFVAAPGVSRVMADALEKQLQEEKTQAFDSHPPLRERIAKADKWGFAGTQPGSQDINPALCLIGELDAAEILLLELMNPALKDKNLQSISWDGIKDQVLRASWQKRVTSLSSLLQPITVETIPEELRDLHKIGSQIPDPPGMLLTHEQRVQRALELLGVALGLVMLDHGWQMVAGPGVFYLVLNSEVANPVQLVSELASAKITAQDWRVRMSEMGILGCSLARNASAAEA